MTQNTAVRQATIDDVQRIRSLVRAAYARWVPVIGREPMPMRVDYAEAFARHRFDLLEVAGSMVGVIESLQHADHLWIENLAVDPQFQGRGYGRALLVHADALARSAGCQELRLLTNAAFTSNIRLYEKSGYSQVRSEPFHLGGTTIYMSKALN